jgi:hypothetical protein
MNMSCRYTFTDYIDDASTIYYDNDKLRAEKGDAAADLADPSSGENPNWTAAGSPRGNPKNNDHYLSIFVTFTYNLNPITKKKPGRPAGKHNFNKRRRKARF